MVTAHKGKTKTLRSRCAACGKQFRHADPVARACSPACRQRLYRQRLKAREQVEQERIEAERREQVRALAERMMAKQASEATPEPSEPRHPPEPAPAPRRRYHHVAPLPPSDQEVIIRMPKRFPMTPI